MQKYGLMFSVLAALLWGVAPVFEKTGLIKISSLAGLTIRYIAITTILLVVSFLTSAGKEIIQADFKTLLFIVISGILAGLLGMWSYFQALKYWEASRVVPIAGAYPLIAFLFSLLILGESLTLQKGIGVIFIVLGVCLMV